MIFARSQALRWRNPGTVRSSIEVKVLAGFVGAILLVAVGGGLTYRATVALADSGEVVVHTQEVRTALGQLYTSVADGGRPGLGAPDVADG